MVDGPRAGRRQRNRVLRGIRETISNSLVGLRRHRLRLLRILQDQGGPGEGDPEAEAPGRGPGRGHGLQRILRAGPDRPGPARRHLLPAAQGRGRPPPRRGAPAQGPAGQEADVRPAGREAARPQDEGHRVLQAPAADRPAQPRPDRPGEDRRVHRLRRLRGPGQGPDRDDARGDHRRDHAPRACAAAAAPASRPGKKWAACAPGEADARNTSSATATRATRARSWTASVLEADPHAVLEGHDHRGQGHRRREGLHLHPRRVPPGRQARRASPSRRPGSSGLLGEDILGTGFDFDLEIVQGAGRLRLRRGDGPDRLDRGPDRRCPGSGRPTRPRRASGASRRSSTTSRPGPTSPTSSAGARPGSPGLGTETSKGTKIFSLVGKINNTGLVEVPMGITLREIIFGIGGGIPDGREFKAVQIGGPSGGCLPRPSCSTCPSTTRA